MSDFEQEFNEVVGETQCLLELDEVDARMIFNAGVKAAKQSMQGESIPAGFALVPIKETKAIRLVVEQEDWEWRDVLAAAGSITEYEFNSPDYVETIADLQAQVDALREDVGHPRLTVKICSFPESNGKRNWTAQLVRVGDFDGLIGTAGGITLAHSELWNKVAYEAERTRYLLGERDTEPHILDYGDDIKTPEEWKGETRLRHLNAIDAAISKGGE